MGGKLKKHDHGKVSKNRSIGLINTQSGIVRWDGSSLSQKVLAVMKKGYHLTIVIFGASSIHLSSIFSYVAQATHILI